MSKLLALCTVLCVLAAIPFASSQPISDPENVTYMKVGIIQSGKLKLNSQSSLATAEDLKLSLYVPQNDSRQSSRIVKIIGPESYSIGEEEYGNAQVVMEWKNPPIDRDIDYLVETEVETETKSSGETRDFPLTSVIEPSEGIIETSYTLSSGKKSVEDMFAIGAWVNENVDYDISCEREAFPAKWVFDEGRGTCDEFSNLMLSMLRTLGYNAWYIAGYAYLGGKQEGGESFGSHAWVEASLGGKTYGMDPTWAEAPVDATHIAFARLPDSNFTEHTGVKSRDIEMQWEKDETRLTLKDYREMPRIEVDLEAVPGSVYGGKNVLITAEMEADGCVMTTLRIASCVDEGGKNLIDVESTKKAVYFCDNRKFHWIGKTPEIKSGMKYTCPVSSAAGGGRVKTGVSITSEPSAPIDISASMQKIVLPGQKMDVRVGFKNTGYTRQDLRVFAIIGDYSEEGELAISGRESATAIFHPETPKTAGEYDLYVFSSSGDLTKERVRVITERKFSITEIELPGEMLLGQKKTINITVASIGNETEASVQLQAGKTRETKPVTIALDGEFELSFDYTAESEGSVNVIISLLSGDGAYQDSWTGNINIEKELSLKEGIAKQIEDFIAWIINSIRGIFGL
jgi:hypothetical protein